MELNLLEKSEIRVENARLKDANLTDIARAVAGILSLAPDEVLVVDVREDHFVLDVLRKTVDAASIVAKEKRILDVLAEVPGVLLTPQSRIHSQGVLGLIALDEALASGVLERSFSMAEDVRRHIARRASVFASGFEVQRGMIEDTNTAYIVGVLEEHGFAARRGGILEDDDRSIASRLRQVAEDGFGLIITTGGVGAEDKDRTVEGILSLDPEAAVPWIVKYEKGTGRHVKEGVRIAVGKYGECLMVALPGPNDEVRAAMAELIAGLEEKAGGACLASRIAGRLRSVLLAKMAHRQGGASHHDESGSRDSAVHGAHGGREGV